jgi:general secretion pathway protein G
MTFRTVGPLIVVIVLAGAGVLNVGASRRSLLRAKEEGLRDVLKVMREVIGQYRADKGLAPRSLETLVREGYLRKVPTDPITRSAHTWQLHMRLFDRVGQGSATRPGLLEVHSGALATASDGTSYSSW